MLKIQIKQYEPFTIVIVLPAFNEENSIGETLDSINSLRVPEGLSLDIFIGLDNCTDDTESVVSSPSDSLNIYTLETVNNKERKVGNLNQIYRLFMSDMSEQAEPLAVDHLKAVTNIVAYLGIDADVYLDKACLLTLYSELNSKFNIGGVSANYTSLMPLSKRRLKHDDPEAECKIKQGRYGGPVARFITAQQNKSFTSWTLEQKHNGYQASILGGQCTLFRPKALQEIYDKHKLNGIYDNATDTEDLLLTQQLRALGWQCRISDSARAYVDSMKTMHSYVAQSVKWSNGKLDYITQVGMSTAYARKHWLDQLTLLMNITIRIMLLLLIPASIIVGEFTYNWIWAVPIVFSILINTVVAIKTPRARFIDVLLSVTTISAEFAIWFDGYVSLKSWQQLSKVEKTDGWAAQYQAENRKGGISSGFIATVIIAILIATGLATGVINIRSLLVTIKPYIHSGFNLLTYMTIFTTVLMIRKAFKIRGKFNG